MTKNKFDTNQLDPDFPQKVAAESQTQPTLNLPENYGAETRRFDEASETEDRTRRFGEAEFNSYQTPQSEQPPARYEATHFAETKPDSARKVEKVGLPENILTALPYIPWYIGLVAGLVILLFVPKSETKVRFHAAQGLAAHVAIMIVSAVLSMIGNVTDVADWGNAVFNIVTMVMLIIFAVKAFQGKPVHIESVDDLTNWLEEKIKPIN